MGDPLTPTAARVSRWWALPVALTVAATGLLWDPGTTAYSALKGVLLPLGALAAALAAWAKLRRGGRWELDGVTLALLGLLTWAGISLCWTPSVAAGLSDLAPALAAVTLLVCGRVLLRPTSAARVLTVAVTTAGLLASGVVFTEHGLGRPVLTGTIGNPNHLAAFLVATVPFAGWMACWPTRASARQGVASSLPTRLLRGTALVGPLLVAVALTGCRSAWLALGAGALVAGALTRPTRRGRGLALGAALVGFGVLAALASRGPDRWRQSLAGRLYLARISLSLVAARPAAGHGVGSYALRFPEHQATRLENHPEERSLWTHAQTAHCEPLQGLVELGLPGGVLILLVTILLVREMIGPRERGPPPLRQRVGAVSLVILAVSGLAEGSLHNVALLTLATAGAALLLRPRRTRRHVAAVDLGSRLSRVPGVAVILAFTASALTVTAARHYAADRLLARAHLTRQPHARARLLRRSIHLSPNPGRARFYLALTLARLGHTAAAAQKFRLSALDFPNLGTTVALGNALMARGRYREAADAYRRAVRLHPRYAAAHHNLGVALRRLGLRRAARLSFRRARRLWPGRWLEPWRIRVIRRHTRPS